MTANKVKAVYLIMYMAFAFWRVFYNVYLEDLGFKGAEIGTINAFYQSTIIIVVTFWGVVADKQGIRPTLRYLVIASAICVFTLRYIHSFWILIFFIPVITVFHHPLGPLTDALAVQYAQTDSKHSYGSLRLWGSLGWALASIIGGFVFTYIDVRYAFTFSSVFFIALIPFIYTTRKRKTIYRPNFQRIPFKELITNKPLLIFIGILSLYGIACAPVNSYLNLYFKELHSENSMIGIAYAIQAFSELPFFIIGARLVVKLGAKRVISISIIAMTIRMVLYGFIPNPYFALGVGILQGISLSFFLVGAVEYLYQLMPPGRHATAQSIIWSTYIGVGQMTGNFVIGILKDTMGMVKIMQVFAIVTLLSFLLTGWYFQRIKTRENNFISP